jgi:hypothetical protein
MDVNSSGKEFLSSNFEQNFELKGALNSAKVEKMGYVINSNFFGLFN